MRLFPLPFSPKKILREWGPGEPRLIGPCCFQRHYKRINRDWRDLWVGMFWDRESEEVDDGRYCGSFVVYICPVPVLVFEFAFSVVYHLGI